MSRGISEQRKQLSVSVAKNITIKEGFTSQEKRLIIESRFQKRK